MMQQSCQNTGRLQYPSELQFGVQLLSLSAMLLTATGTVLHLFTESKGKKDMPNCVGMNKVMDYSN